MSRRFKRSKKKRIVIADRKVSLPKTRMDALYFCFSNSCFLKALAKDDFFEFPLFECKTPFCTALSILL